MFRRDKDTRRTANSIRTHQKTMEAFGRAAGGWERAHHNTGNSTYAEYAVNKTQPGFYPGQANVNSGGLDKHGIAGIEKSTYEKTSPDVMRFRGPLTSGRGHVITSDGRIGTRGVSEFSRPTALNKKKLASRSEYYKDVHGFDPADDYKAPKKGKK